MTDPSGRKKVRLTEKETAILKYLYRAGDQVIGRDTLLGEVWGYNAGVTTHTLETHVYRLRQKIERDPAQCRNPGHRARRLPAGAVNFGDPAGHGRRSSGLIIVSAADSGYFPLLQRRGGVGARPVPVRSRSGCSISG